MGTQPFLQRRWLIGGAITLTLLIGFVMWTSLGLAHAEPERSEPASGSTVSPAPTQVVIYFTQEINADGTVVRVLDATGAQVDLGDTTLDLYDASRKRVTISLSPNLPSGIYTVEWTSASSEDAETANGSFTFTVTGGATPAASPVGSPVASPIATPGAPIASTPGA